MSYPIILIEGCDASGKTTLANKLMEHYPNCVYIHNAVTDDILSLHMNTLSTAKLASDQHAVIIDRLHLSENVYGTIYRNGTSYDYKQIDAIVDSIKNLKKILCIVDKDTALYKHAERKDKEMFDDVSKVWDMYNETSGNWIRYNWKTDDLNLDTFEVSKKA